MDIVENIPKYNLNEEEEKKEILRHYRGLLRLLKAKAQARR
jgi:guanosine-3',5'-bis(diphosphate) 3'-pyrophosphohydrolase